jgi:hypothetical protein
MDGGIHAETAPSRIRVHFARHLAKRPVVICLARHEINMHGIVSVGLTRHSTLVDGIHSLFAL